MRILFLKIVENSTERNRIRTNGHILNLKGSQITEERENNKLKKAWTTCEALKRRKKF